MAMTALMLYSYKETGQSVNYVSPVSTLTAVTLAAVMFVDDTDLIFASDCEEEMTESFIDKVQEGISNWSQTVMATGGEINLKKSFAKSGFCVSTKRQDNVVELPRTTLKVPQRGDQ